MEYSLAMETCAFQVHGLSDLLSIFPKVLEKCDSEGKMRAFKFDKSVKIKAADMVIKLYIFGRASN